MPVSNEEKCHRCDGCGLIASSERGEPWTAWTSLPLHSSAAVLMGVVRPIPCPACAPRPGDLIETECLVCKSGGDHFPRGGPDPHGNHAGDRWVVQSVTPERHGRIQIYVTASTGFGTPIILEYTGRNIKIVKRREERVAERFMES